MDRNELMSGHRFVTILFRLRQDPSRLTQRVKQVHYRGCKVKNVLRLSLISWVASATLLACAQGALGQAPSPPLDHVPGQLLIGFESEEARETFIKGLDAHRSNLRAAGEQPDSLSIERRSGAAAKLTIDLPERVKDRFSANPQDDLASLLDMAEQIKRANPGVTYAIPRWILPYSRPAGVPVTPMTLRNFGLDAMPQGTPACATPNDPIFQAGLHWHYEAPPAGMNARGAWCLPGAAARGSRDIVVAVLDTGFRFEHEDARTSSNIARNSGYNFVSYDDCMRQALRRSADPTDPGDVCPRLGEQSPTWHGTHVASTIGAIATNNSTGMSGVAWNVTVVPVRVFGPASAASDDVADAIRWAAGLPVPGVSKQIGRRADVINMSLGTTANCQTGDMVRNVRDAIADARKAGTVIVAAAGNGADYDAQHRACEPGPNNPQCRHYRENVNTETPAGCPGVISVAAHDRNGNLAWYSNYGNVTIMAPGGDISVAQDYVINGRRASYPLGVLSAVKDGYAFFQGTSQAAPHVSGAIALALAMHPEWRGKPDEIDKHLRASAVRPRPGACPVACGPGQLDAVRFINSFGSSGPIIGAGR
jgi:subtilisin family serine protease